AAATVATPAASSGLRADMHDSTLGLAPAASSGLRPDLVDSTVVLVGDLEIMKSPLREGWPGRRPGRGGHQAGCSPGGGGAVGIRGLTPISAESVQSVNRPRDGVSV